MECNNKEEEEARRAMDIAESKLIENDYVEAKKFVNKAHSLYPKLDGLKQLSKMVDVFISASNGGREADWYGILGVDSLADDETVKKHYKKLALLLHPDKNRFHGAEDAFKLVLEAWCVLSDKDRRIMYDEKMKSKQAKSRKQQKPPKPHEPASSSNPKPPKPHEQAYPKPDFGTFWTMCNRCKTYCEYARANYLNKTLPCPNCGKDFVATEIIPEIINGWPFIRLSPFVQSTSEGTSYRAKAENQLPERVKRWFQTNPKHEPAYYNKSKPKVVTFWTVCNTCKTYYEFVRSNYLNKTLPCPNCGQHFVATEIIPEIINGSPVIRLKSNYQSKEVE